MPTCVGCSQEVEVNAAYCQRCGTPNPDAKTIPTPHGGETAEHIPVDHLRVRLQAALGVDFHVEQLLGEGGFAVVFLVTERKLSRRIAVKVLRPELTASVSGVRRFAREAESAASLNHPHILSIFFVGQGEGLVYFGMPLVEGESLDALLAREGQLAEAEVVRLGSAVADALAEAHAGGLVHRDIKPANILLQGKGRRPLVTDFGIAKAAKGADDKLTGTGVVIGSPHYMSPEQAGGSSDIDHRSDIYSLGIVLWQMLAGSVPFDAPDTRSILMQHLTQPLPSLRERRPSVRADLARVVERCASKAREDRFASAAEVAAALQAALSAELPSPTRRSLRRKWIAAGAGMLILAVLFLLGRLVVRNLSERAASHTYGVTSQWSAWRGWTGEDFSLVGVAESALVVSRFGAAAAQLFDGKRWTALSIPDSFDLRPYVGAIPNSRLFAAKLATSPSGQPLLQYWWMSLSPDAVRPLEAISGYLPDEARSRWWADARDLVTWFSGIQRLDGRTWVREATGVASRIATVWGSDVNHRFALPSMPSDSLLVFDGISWKLVDILGGRFSGRPSYNAGATFGDGATVVVGEECMERERCRPLILEQDRFDGGWRRVPIPAGIGIPIAVERDTTGRCDPGRFSLGEVAGRARSDYIVWGAWLTCDVASPEREASGCPPGQPCVWQVDDGRLKPVEELLGETVQAVVYMDTTAYALVDDGTLWRRVGGHWRRITRVPGLPPRRVGASPQLIVRVVGGTIRYEPGRGDSLSHYFVSPEIGVPTGVAEATPPRQLVVRDSSAALLTADGSAFISRCRMVRPVRSAARVSELTLRCPKWSRLPPAPRLIAGVDFLADGRLVGVGARGLAVTWRNGAVETELLPEAARGDSLWGVVASVEGGATAIGTRTVVQRNARGVWTMVRRFPEGRIENHHFALLPDGDLVVAGPAIRVWDRSEDTLPVVTLYQPTLGEAQVSALHVLADGRLVAGFANPDEPTLGGRLVVWQPPARASRALPVELPLNLDITDLADDGRYLYVVGRGGALAIPLDSLPFAKLARPH
jgi:hypothetical protein